MGLHFPGVALVTGAGSGIGRATALLFAKEGCNRIAIADLDKSSVDELKDEINSQGKGVEALSLHVDITSEESVDSMVAETTRVLGRVDYACNVAGVLLPGPTDEVAIASFDLQQRVNLRGTWLCQRAQIKQMLKQEPIQAEDSRVPARGAIANVASMCALMAYDHLPAYCASKHGILGFTRSDGLRYAKNGIRINAICPGVIRTAMLGDVPESDVGMDVQAMVQDMAVGRLGLPEEVAECIVWITSGRASLVTASTLSPNGGMIGA
ncbi:oxidoreductase [Ilyonectria sp. MPI-CAGE-AT-0026]|nr:oxidoreductase [Ilyonectria sp. MPI-CAGE-AT-0026]